jgi:carbon starvation protein CstA
VTIACADILPVYLCLDNYNYLNAGLCLLTSVHFKVSFILSEASFNPLMLSTSPQFMPIAFPGPPYPFAGVISLGALSLYVHDLLVLTRY